MFYTHVWLTPIRLFALVLAPKSDLAAQAYGESVFCFFTRYVISVLDIIYVFLTSVFAARV